MEGYIKLKDLENVSSHNVDMSKIMVDSYGFKNSGVFRSLRFTRCFHKVFADVNKVRGVDVSKVELKECSINVPENIEMIPYAAMMNIHTLLSNNNLILSELVANIVASACFSSNVKQPFESECIYYSWFVKKVLNQPILEMFGIYNWVVKAIKDSGEKWDKLFFSVEVEDQDYKIADNGRGAQFNVINTIKKTCQDFNVTEKMAWQMPFMIVQVNNYEGASKAYTQYQMSKLKEIKFRAERDRQNSNL